MSESKFYTAKEVANLLKLNLLTVYDFIRDGRLPAIKFGRNYRIMASDFEEFIRDHRVSKISNS